MDDVLRRKVWRFLAGELSRDELTAWVASQIRHPVAKGRLSPLWASMDHALCLPDLTDEERREELRRLAEAKAAAGVAEWEAARDAAWEAFWDVASSKRADQDGYWDGVAWDGAWLSAWLATFAIIMGDLLSPEHIADLTGPWRETFGPTWEEQA